ncbi:MAG: SDR family oxidoreductase, partial [Thermoplasmata archaeon]
ITGAASGMGRATALRLAQEGCRVAVVDIDDVGGSRTTSTIEDAGGLSFFVKADVSDEPSVINAVAQAAKSLGSFDTLVNTAGVAYTGSVADTSEADWDRVLDINLKGTFLMIKHLIPRFLSAGSGSIINVASNAGLVGVRNLSAYCASKGGVVQLSQALALELAALNIRVNTVAPSSTVRTRMFDARLGRSSDPKALGEALAAANPMKRLCTPEDVAELILYIVSDRASYVTGGIFPIDGGLTAA